MNLSRRSFTRWLILLSFVFALVFAGSAPAVRAATWTVTNANDSGAGSLRQAIINAASGDTITFTANYTITLSSQLDISKNVTIDGETHHITISGNNAVRVFNVNAGITFNLRNLTVANGNVSSGNGGGIANAGTLNVTTSTFSGNSAGSGGGIFNTGALNVTNSTFSGNGTSFQGGGIYNLGTVTVINSTFAGGSAYQGGGIFNGGTLNMTNSIIANNTGSNCFAFYPIGGSNNLASDGTCGAGFTTSSASLLSALGNYGGSTPTLALLPGSAAIDAGSDAVCAAAPVSNLDQRGLARAQGAHCDIGAFESRAFVLTISGGNDQTTHTNTAFPNPLALTVTSASGDPVNGGQVTFTAPASGASTNPATNSATVASGAISQVLTANAAGGAYNVIASANGATQVTFALTNTCLSAITVTNANDSGAGSLRQAITDICAGGTITFNDDYTITLASGLTISWSLTIDGVGHAITVSGNNAVRVFYVNAGITFNLSNLTVANGNAAPNSGGGLYNTGTLNVTNSFFSGNYAGGSSGVPSVIFGGGGLYNKGTATVTNSTFYTNSVPYNSGGGGGILNDSGATLTVVNSTFSTNGLPLTLGSGLENLGTATVINSTFFGNIAGSGAGIFNNAMLNVTNSIFSGNSAGGSGGGIANKGTLNVANSTFFSNSAPFGGGLYNQSGTSTLQNSILWGDSGGEISGSSTVSYSIVQGGYAGTSNLNVDPQFVNAAAGDLRLIYGSPAIDAGTNTGCSATDLDNLPRPNDGNGDSTATCDLGAYEAGEMVCGVSASTYNFSNQSGASIQVTTLGGELACLYVDEMERHHPNATGTSGGSGLMTGRYWQIHALSSDKSTPATGFVATLTLPHANLIDPQVCEYTGGAGFGWDCAASSSTATTVTRSGLTSFSDWAVGQQVGPTAVSLRSFAAASALNPIGVLSLTVLFVAVVIGRSVWLKRR